MSADEAPKDGTVERENKRVSTQCLRISQVECDVPMLLEVQVVQTEVGGDREKAPLRHGILDIVAVKGVLPNLLCH